MKGEYAARDGLFERLRSRAVTHGRRAIEVYTSEHPEFRALAADDKVRARMLDVAVLLRRRVPTLAADNAPFTTDDLDHLAAVGRERGGQGISLPGHRHILVLQTVLTLREIQESARAEDIEQLTRLLDWVTTHGPAARNAYSSGYLTGQENASPTAKRMQTLATLLLADDSSAGVLADTLNVRLAEQYAVLVIRSARGSYPGVVEKLLRQWWFPMTWQDPGELVALLPNESHGLDVARDVARLLDQPCAAAVATGRTGALTETLTLARGVSRTAPTEAPPRRVHTATDLFVELGAARLPHVDHWMRDLTRKLAGGPDLLTTLNTYYRTDMNRTSTATALSIHPRTLDYRLQRVRELVDIDPGSVHGIRVLTAAVTRALARQD